MLYVLKGFRVCYDAVPRELAHRRRNLDGKIEVRGGGGLEVLESEGAGVYSCTFCLESLLRFRGGGRGGAEVDMAQKTTTSSGVAC